MRHLTFLHYLIRLLVLAVLVAPLSMPARAEAPAVPSNDDFNSPINITSDIANTSIDTIGATQAGDDPLSLCPANGTLVTNWFASVWYVYLPSVPGSLHVDSVGSNYDTEIAVWTGTRGNLDLVSCNDDIVSGTITSSSIDAPVQQGVAYYIEVTQFDNSSPPPYGGNLVLNFRFAGGIVAWERKADMTVDRDLAAAAGGSNNIFVMGGRTCTGICDLIHPLSYTISAENARYTPATNSWTDVAPMPVPTYGHQSAYLDGKIYIPSGFTALSGSSLADGTHRVYDPAANTWTTATTAPWSNPLRPAGYYAVAVNPAGHEYYVLGGRDQPGVTGVYYTGVYRYNTASDTWTTLAPMPVGRFAFAADYIAGKIYVAAGARAGGCQNDGYVYDVAANTWSPIATWAALLVPVRCFVTSVVVPATGVVPYRWQVVGGSQNAFGGESYGTALQYDPNSDTWMSMPGNYNSTISRRAAAAATSTLGTFVFGGNSEYDNGDLNGITPRTESFRPSFTYYVADTAYNAFNFVDPTEPNNDFASAYLLSNHSSQIGYFPYQADLNDYYAISVTVPLTLPVPVDLWLHDLPATENYSLMLYDANYFRVAYSGNPGSSDEHIQYDVPATGRYYIRVYNGRTPGLLAPAYRLTADWP